MQVKSKRERIFGAKATDDMDAIGTARSIETIDAARLTARAQHPDRGLYAGAVFRLRESSHSQTGQLLHAIPELVRRRIHAAFPEGDPRQLHKLLSNAEFLERLHDLRLEVRRDPVLRRLLLRLFASLGLPTHELYCDVPRLRAVPHNGHANESARAVHFLHRDPWYANPQCQWNWWFPVFDIAANQSFSIYPRCFDRAVANDSAQFSWEEWSSQGGFQARPVRTADGSSAPSGQHFPAPLADPADPDRFAVTAKAGELILFSGSHLHGTDFNSSGATRWSLELRSVLREDLTELRGAPNTDNESSGSVLMEYRTLQDGCTPNVEEAAHYLAATSNRSSEARSTSG